jgi:hypothetical protein
VYEHPDEARERGERARRDITTKHTLSTTAEFVRRRFEEIPRHDALLRDVRGPIERAAMIASRDPGAGLLRRVGRVGVVRRLLHRALWPELEEQRRIDAAILDALRGLERISREEFAKLSEPQRNASRHDDGA